MEELTTAPWLNDSFLVEVLRPSEKNQSSVKVLKWWIGQAVPLGTTSQLLKIGVDYELDEEGVKTVTFIVKTPVKNSLMREIAIACNAYKKEVKIYREVLPRMYKLCPTIQKMTAESFRCPLKDSIILEDLRDKGYKMADRFKRLDVDQCRQFFLSLSRFHALSVVMYCSDPDLIDEVGKQVFFKEDNPERVKEEKTLKYFLNGMMYTLKNLPGCERYVKLFHDKIDVFYDLMAKVYKPSDGLNVLNHGDLWTNNILFKYNDFGEITDVKFIDFQYCRFCSFAHDIYLFWWTSTNDEVRENHMEDMFQLYRENLNKTLTELGCRDQLSQQEFDDQMKAFAPFSLQVIANFMSVMLADPDNYTDLGKMSIEDFDKPVSEDSHHWNNFRSKYFKAVLPNILRQVEKLNAFE